ncbi:MAG: YcjX family protein [Methylophaga sp.]|uniref:YcjX family protein n=1 Tax=Methylophaga sp. TaxID=2024840 RepID=UPI00299F0071|nr:YcjX family protein [Methylophaga sp.]MDX1749019.1 YcjX family protein [Methylophaga sp.]
MNSKIEKLGLRLNKTLDGIDQQASKWVARSLDKHLSIGITGFSGSGKSTFITSLIHQLKYSSNANLGGFLPARDERLLNVKLQPLDDLPLFNYQQGIQALADDPPAWPPSTTHISGCRLIIEFKKKSMLPTFTGETRRFTLELRDYPGEWLLDIAMLQQDYRQWSMDTAALCSKGIRHQLAEEMQKEFNDLDPLAPIDEQQIEALFVRYRSFLMTCKTAGLTFIQPGRALLPDSSDFPVFIPLFNLQALSPQALDNADDDSLYKVMQQRYKTYLKNFVQPFYKTFFRGIDRQVVLIDVLKALSGGKEKFDDMVIAFSRIIDCYRVGHNAFLNRLFSPQVEKILFLASKPDRILMNQHESLRRLCDDIISHICPQSVRNRIEIETEIAAAVRTTHDHNDHLTARLLDGQYGELRHPAIPDKLPDPDQWHQLSRWNPPVLRAPLNPDLIMGGRLAHIRMDKVLRDLIGDKF